MTITVNAQANPVGLPTTTNTAQIDGTDKKLEAKGVDGAPPNAIDSVVSSSVANAESMRQHVIQGLSGAAMIARSAASQGADGPTGQIGAPRIGAQTMQP